MDSFEEYQCRSGQNSSGFGVLDPPDVVDLPGVINIPNVVGPPGVDGPPPPLVLPRFHGPLGNLLAAPAKNPINVSVENFEAVPVENQKAVTPESPGAVPVESLMSVTVGNREAVTIEDPKAFPLERLPAELRRRVYMHAFHTKNNILPDPTGYFSRTLGVKSTPGYRYQSHRVTPNSRVFRDRDCNRFHTFGDTVNLLRTSRAINQEASAVLYGSNTFGFGDDGYCISSGCYKNAIETREKTKICGHENGISTMYIFLQIIGYQNRLRLRHVAISILDERYFYYPKERVTAAGFLVPALYDCASNQHSWGKYLGNAIFLLAQGHRLSILEIKLREYRGLHTELFEELGDHFFRDPEHSELIRQFQKLKGVKAFAVDVEGWPQMKTPHFKKYQCLKLAVEAERPTSKTETINRAVVGLDWAALPDMSSTLESDKYKSKMSPVAQEGREMLIGERERLWTAFRTIWARIQGINTALRRDM